MRQLSVKNIHHSVQSLNSPTQRRLMNEFDIVCIHAQEYSYFHLQIGMVFQKIQRDLSALRNWGPPSGFLPSRFSFVFVCNHDKYVSILNLVIISI